MDNDNLYHIHRNENQDNLWYVGNEIIVDDNFQSNFYTSLLKEERPLVQRYGVYDIDYFIAMMEEMKLHNFKDSNNNFLFHKLLHCCYSLRRERALEEGRKIFALNCPSRMHSIFLTGKSDLSYWENCVGNQSFHTFSLNCNGNLFVSSDSFFPQYTLLFDKQVEQSKIYWNPEIEKVKHKEILFQGTAKIIG